MQRKKHQRSRTLCGDDHTRLKTCNFLGVKPAQTRLPDPVGIITGRYGEKFVRNVPQNAKEKPYLRKKLAPKSTLTTKKDQKKRTKKSRLEEWTLSSTASTPPTTLSLIWALPTSVPLHTREHARIGERPRPSGSRRSRTSEHADEAHPRPRASGDGVPRIPDR